MGLKKLNIFLIIFLLLLPEMAKADELTIRIREEQGVDWQENRCVFFKDGCFSNIILPLKNKPYPLEVLFIAKDGYLQGKFIYNNRSIAFQSQGIESYGDFITNMKSPVRLSAYIINNATYKDLPEYAVIRPSNKFLTNIEIDIISSHHP